MLQQIRGPTGKTLVASLQYENLGCSVQLWDGDVDEVARINHLCNQVAWTRLRRGQPSCRHGAGVIPSGREGAKDLVRQIGQRHPLGRVLGSGVVVTGRVWV